MDHRVNAVVRLTFRCINQFLSLIRLGISIFRDGGAEGAFSNFCTLTFKRARAFSDSLSEAGISGEEK